jgi:hypothetical protein
MSLPALKIVDQKPAVAEDELRQALSVAIAERDQALAKRDACRDVCERSHRFVAELEARQQACAARDAAAIAERAAHFKAALVEATTPSLSTSAKLSTSALARVEAENAVEAARQAQAAIAEELEEAEDRLVLLQGNVERASKVIVGAHADHLARELREAEHATALLRRRLLGATQLRPGGAFPLNANTMSVARGDTRETYAHAEFADTAYFNRFLAALCLDAEAQPEEA